ncbi:MAG: hypothetical protein ABIS06_07645 [Vicinamibacterales bacterium]
MHDIRYDDTRDEFVVGNPFARAILTFAGGADGEAAPKRVIQGPLTRISNPDRVELDSVHGEIFVPNRDSILVFPRDATGNVAPSRVIEGPATQLAGIRALVVDPVNNLLIAGTDLRNGEESGLVIFERTAEGNATPLRIIRGPNTGIKRVTQMQVYPPGGWIVVTQPGEADVQEPEGAFVGIWSVYANGDVPPKWVIGGPKSRLKKPRGVALNAANKEMIVADMRVNAVFTFRFPELFEQKATRPVSSSGK